MRITRILLFFIYTLLLFACKDPKSQIARQITQTGNINSARLLFEQYPSDSNGMAYLQRVKQLCQQNLDTSLSNQYIQVLFKVAEEKNNSLFLNLAERGKTFQQFLVGNPTETRYWAQRMLQSANSHKEIDRLDVYHLAGIAYYTPPMVVDSTLKYWKIAYREAVEHQDDYRIYFFANNLGTLFYELDMFVISREFFLRAFNQAKINNTVSAVLMNNILNTLIKTDNFAEAAKFFETNQSYFNINPSDYQNQSIYLNSIYINQRLKRYSRSEALIKSFPLSKVHATLKAQYIALHIRQFLHSENLNYINDTIKNEAQLHGIGLLHNFPNDAKQLDKPELKFLWKIIEDDVNQLRQKGDFGKIKSRQLLHALNLLIQKYEYDDPAKHNKYKIAYGEISRLALATDVEINQYISEVKQVDGLFDRLMARNKELEFQKRNNRQIVMLTVLLFVILIISILYYRKKIQLKQKQEEMLIKDKDLLIRENAMNQRMVVLSKELMNFTKKIKLELDRANLKADNAALLQKIRSELMGFMSVNLNENPKVVDHAISSKSENELIPEDIWNELNKTEKRVYSLVKEGFKPNEISGMLGVSTQHIYNIKNKLKRLKINID